MLAFDSLARYWKKAALETPIKVRKTMDYGSLGKFQPTTSHCEVYDNPPCWHGKKRKGECGGLVDWRGVSQPPSPPTAISFKNW